MKNVGISQEICLYPETIEAALESITKAKENGVKWITNSDSNFLGLAFHTKKPQPTKYFHIVYNPNLDIRNLPDNPIQGKHYDYVECVITYHCLEIDTFSQELECLTHIKIVGKVPEWYKSEPRQLEEINIKDIAPDPSLLKLSLFDFYKMSA